MLQTYLNVELMTSTFHVPPAKSGYEFLLVNTQINDEELMSYQMTRR